MSAPTALVVFAHPVPGSLNDAVRDRVRDGFMASGWSVDDLDLHSVDFDPCVNADELAGRPREDPVIEDHLARLRSADALVFVHPTWWGAQPAVLKGWLDRVLCHPDGSRSFGGVRRLVVVCTHGSSRARNAAQGVPGRRIALRLVRAKCHPLARSSWIAFYGNDRAREAKRTAHLDRVEREIALIAEHRPGVSRRGDRAVGAVTSTLRRLRARRR